jgi:hypothetical protein
MSFRKKFERAMGFIVGAGLTSAGLYLLWIAMNGFYSQTFILTGRAQAEITAKEVFEPPQRSVLHYKFNVADGQTVAGQAEAPWGTFESTQIGDEGWVMFDPSNPETRMFWRDGPKSPISLFIFFVLPLLAVGTRSLRSSWLGIPSEDYRSNFAAVRFFDAGGIGSIIFLVVGGWLLLGTFISWYLGEALYLFDYCALFFGTVFFVFGRNGTANASRELKKN